MTRARVEGVTGTYKLTLHQRDHVGILYCLGLWTSTAIAAHYGVDRCIVSRHGRRVAERFAAEKLRIADTAGTVSA